MEEYSCSSRQYNKGVNLETSLCALKENKLSLSYTDISMGRFPIWCYFAFSLPDCVIEV